MSQKGQKKKSKPRPKPKLEQGSKPEKSKSPVLTCHRLDEILDSKCSEVLDEETYHNFQTKYMNQFFSKILKEDESCLGGELNIAIREPENNVFDQYRITEFKVDRDKCDLLETVVIPIRTSFAPFNFKQAKTPEEIKEQYDSLGGQGHYTVLVVNTTSKEIEYFETNGSSAGWLPVTEKAIRDAFVQGAKNQAIPSEWSTYEFIWPGQFCPRISWQGLAQTQTCAYWSTLFAVLRVACPNVSRTELVESILNQGKEYLLKLLQAWHCFMWNYAKKHHILSVPKTLEAWQKVIDTQETAGPAFGSFTKFDRNTKVEIANKIVDAYNQAQILYWDKFEPEEAHIILTNASNVFNSLRKRYNSAYSASGNKNDKAAILRDVNLWINGDQNN